jgi:hydrogenase nickel incorporation protein HypA/HybF
VHEIGLCQAVLDAVERRAQGRRVLGLKVRAGVMQHLTQESVDGAFGLLAEGTVAEGARIHLVQVPAHYHCAACGNDGETDRPLVVCPSCHSDDITVTGGDEVTLESIEVVAAEAS